MGQSTNGVLVFGIDLGEELPLFVQEWVNEDDENRSEFGDWVYAQSGLPTYGQPGHDYSKERAFIDAYPVQMVLHCSGDSPMYILAVPGTELTARRGYPEVVDPDSFIVDTVRLTQYFSWVKEHEIEGTPKWLLCSMWS